MNARIRTHGQRYIYKQRIWDALQSMGYDYFTAHNIASNYVRWGLRDSPSWESLSTSERIAVRKALKQVRA